MGIIYYKYRNKILQSHTCITLIGYRGKKRRQREPDAAMEEGWMDVYTKSRWAHVTGTISTFSGTGPEPGPALTGLSGFYQTGEILIWFCLRSNVHTAHYYCGSRDHSKTSFDWTNAMDPIGNRCGVVRLWHDDLDLSDRVPTYLQSAVKAVAVNWSWQKLSQRWKALVEIDFSWNKLSEWEMPYLGSGKSMSNYR